MNIETDGTITPRDAVYQAVQILMDHFSIVLDGAKDESNDVRVIAAKEEAVEEDQSAKESDEEKPKAKKKAAKKKSK